MQIRRCAVLYLEPREDLAMDWSSLFAGTSALQASVQWIAMAPHLDAELEIGGDAMAALGAIGPTLWLEQAECEHKFGAAVIDSLLRLGLLISDGPQGEAVRARDEALRSQHWRPLSALAHTFSRWGGTEIDKGTQFASFEEWAESYGPLPPLAIERCTDEQAIRLPAPAGAALDAAMFQRYTGRNFDPEAVLPLATAARLLQRTFGAQGQREMAEGAFVLKKFTPSGGSLHPVEAYVLVQRVEGVAPGLYHYHPVKHALEPLEPGQDMDTSQTGALAMRMVAGQDWFVAAPMIVVLAARVERNFWKYRNHPKAHRAILLDAGHLSQTFYLLAAEAGLPAFITAAINERDIEQALGLDPLRDMVIAVCGCGAGSGAQDFVEIRYQP